jgi:CBS domain-containing protein
MKVQELMTKQVVSCEPTTSLNDVAHLMWVNDCGSIPVVVSDPRGRKVIGMVTDRDACMAAYHQGRTLKDLRVEDAMSRELVSCFPQDDVSAAQELMQRTQVRRVPVVDERGTLVGLLSLADIARASEDGRRSALPKQQVAETLASITASRHPNGSQGCPG